MVTDLADVQDTDAGDIGDGEQMVLPYLIGGAFALSTLHSGLRAFETYRYWTDYYHNTGYRPRYPVRAGLYDGLSTGAQALYGVSAVYPRGGYKADLTYNPYEYGMYW